MSRVYYPSARAVLNVKLGLPTEASKDLPNTVVWTLPKSATVHRNRAEMADSFELTFDERDCPFDPSTILAGEVSIYLYNSPAMLERDRLFDRGELVRDKTEGARQEQLELRSEQFTFESEPTVVGLIDEVRREMGSGGRWITIQGQDYTALLLQKQWPPARGNRPRRIPTGRKLDVVLEEMLREVDPSGTLRLELHRVKASELPIVKDDGINKGKRGIPVESETKYWDVMVKTAQRSGFRLYVEGLRVVLENPRSEFREDARRRVHLAWGQNIEDISVSRKLGIEKAPAIVMTGYDPKTKRRIEVVYPEGFEKRAAKGKSKKSKSPDLSNSGEYQVIPTNITDEQALKRMAKARYADIGKAERVVTLSTRDLTDLDGQNLLDLRSGDAVQLTFDDYNREMLSSTKLSEAQKLAILIERGFSGDAALAIVSNYSKLESFKRALFLREVSFSYDNEGGITIEMELVDFVVFGDDSAKAEHQDADGNRLGVGSSKRHEKAVIGVGQ